MSGTALHRPACARPAARPAKPVVQHGWAKPVVQHGWLAWLAAMLRAIETRRHLAQMDERMLRDIGLTRGDAIEEANRAPWDLSARPRTAPWLQR